jgi:hypothetical protein
MKSLKMPDKDYLVSKIHDLIRTLNHGYDYDENLAKEWVNYLQLLLDGNKENLENPYGDIDNYHVSSFSQSTPGLDQIDSLVMLDELPTSPPTSQNLSATKLRNSLFITALGGIDSTFYKDLSPDESVAFANAFFASDLVRAFEKYNVVHLIPRGFAAQKSTFGQSVTNTESMILQAYAAGIRNVAVIANAMTWNAIDDFLQEKFSQLTDLNILVTAQPLLPRIKAENGDLKISQENGAYPGGHGHGFKYCLNDNSVQKCIKKNKLRYFIFTNGDNAAVLNWGGEHFEAVLNKLDDMKKIPGHENLRIGFFLVWEYLRKGGFSFLLRHKKSGRLMPQIFEAELAEKSGADIHKLETSRGGYNTNVAIGILQDVYSHLERLPMVLKSKRDNKSTLYSFEASLATAITTFQTANGRSKFDAQSAINILGPKSATYQHWNHIALRKRDDLFAFHSSLFKIDRLELGSKSYPFILTRRDATQKHPTLNGNFVDPDVLNTKSFFDIFVDANFDVEDFYGTLKIDLLDSELLPRGIIKFENNIRLVGDEDSCIECTVPAGEKWIISSTLFKADKKRTITPDDATVLKWDAATKRYL